MVNTFIVNILILDPGDFEGQILLPPEKESG